MTTRAVEPSIVPLFRVEAGVRAMCNQTVFLEAAAPNLGQQFQRSRW